MSLAIVSIIVFCALLAIALVAILLVKSFGVGSAGGRAGSVQIRRQPTVIDESPADTPNKKLDQAFDHLMLETGLNLAPMVAVLLILLCGIAVGGVIFVYSDAPFPAIWGVIFGMVLPILFFIVRRDRRMREIQEQLPSVLDLMARAVHAGETLDQAIELVSTEATGSLGSEFKWCSRQLSLGMPISSAMRTLARRIRLMDIRILAGVLSVHRKTGGNLAMTLERLAGVSRDRLNYRSQMRATTGAGRVSSRLIASAAPVLFLFLFFSNPEHVQRFFDNPLGKSLFLTGALLEIIGLVWLMRLVRIDY